MPQVHTHTNITPPHNTDFLLCQACAIEVAESGRGTSTQSAHTSAHTSTHTHTTHTQHTQLQRGNIAGCSSIISDTLSQCTYCTHTAENLRSVSTLLPSSVLQPTSLWRGCIAPTAQLILHTQGWPYKVTSLLDQGRHSCILKP